MIFPEARLHHLDHRPGRWAGTRICRWLLLLVAVGGGTAIAADSPTTERISLAGEWRCALGSPEPAFPQGALPHLTLRETVRLPGTTETNGIGPENTARELGGLTRVRKFDGVAWYQREIEIPASWSGRHIELRLERTKSAEVWLDDRPVGEQRLFTAPQVYDLTGVAAPGRHRLTILVDNRVERLPFTPNVHQFNSDNAQTNWNGILGRLELVALPPLWLADVQVRGDMARRQFSAHITAGHLPASAVETTISLAAESFNHAGPPHRAVPVSQQLSAEKLAGGVDMVLPLGPEAKTWDEFAPALYRVVVRLESAAGVDERVLEVGLREFRTRGTHFTINGRTTLLRGRHDAGAFPLTGHPPMDLAGWLAYLGLAREYGLNHVRFHTWTPPEAAFQAADRLGIYLQPELPFWGTFDAGVRDFLMPEAEAMLRAYGNHPSFVMLTLANEAGGDRAVMNQMVVRLRQLDGRRLYSDGCNNVLWDVRHQPTNDFWVTAKTRTPAQGERQVAARGSFYFGDGYDGVVQWGAAQTRSDLSAAVEGLPVPVIGHETGQYTVYPDFREIAKYTGVTRPRNLEHFRDALARRGRLEQADAFFRASGALAASLYQEEIELALRTAGMGGFQLLDLQDYPGQGTALVGMLDAFMDSKGLVTPERWREFCGPVVPLARFDHYCWTSGQTYIADLELAHYGAADLRSASTLWRMVTADGREVVHGVFGPADLEQGGLRMLGRVEVKLPALPAPVRCELIVSVEAGATRVSNRWPLWVFPEAKKPEPSPRIHVVRAFDAETKALLAAGARVVLMPDQANRGATVRGAYATDFWCWPMFNSSPGTMGLLIDPEHPALAQFPTARHSERLWSRIAHAAWPVILAGTNADFRPIVQVIDNLQRNELIGLIFEGRVGPGSLLVIACDLRELGDAPEVRQLWTDLLAYAASPAFEPRQVLTVAELDQSLRPSLALGCAVTASSSLTPPWGFAPRAESAVDGDINTRWQAAADDLAPSLTIDLGAACALDTVELLWQTDGPDYQYLLEAAPDHESWQVVSDQRQARLSGGRHTLAVKSNARYVRVKVTGWPSDQPPALREARVLGVRPSAQQRSSTPTVASVSTIP